MILYFSWLRMLGRVCLMIRYFSGLCVFGVVRLHGAGPSGPSIQHWKCKEVHQMCKNTKKRPSGANCLLMRLFGVQL